MGVEKAAIMTRWHARILQLLAAAGRTCGKVVDAPSQPWWFLRVNIDEKKIWNFLVSRLTRSKSDGGGLSRAWNCEVHTVSVGSAQRITGPVSSTTLFQLLDPVHLARPWFLGKVVPKQFAREKLWKHHSKHNFAPALFLAALQWIVMSCFIVSNSEDAELLQLWTIGSQHVFFSWGYPFHLAVDPFSGSRIDYSEHYGWNLSKSIL